MMRTRQLGVKGVQAGLPETEEPLSAEDLNFSRHFDLAEKSAFLVLELTLPQPVSLCYAVQDIWNRF